jgi:hypothetical protein
MVNQARLGQLQGAARARNLAEPVPLAAPLKGWNTRDAFEAMDPLDAIALDNFQPDFGGVRLREGTRLYHQVGGPDPVTTLAVWTAGGTSHLLAAAGGPGSGVIAGADTGLIYGSGFHSSWWQTSEFNRRLFWVNGVDPPQRFDGTNLAAAGFVKNPASPYTLDPNTLVGVATIHNRLYFWTGFEAGFWYGGLFAITGNLDFFPFEMVSGAGAFLVNVQVLTFDGGTGVAAYTIFALSSGEALVYSGTDPSDPANFSLVGIYTIPAPVAVRAMARYGGEAYITTSADHARLTQQIAALVKGETAPRSKATGIVQQRVAEGRNLRGWQAVYWGFGQRVIVNVPLVGLDPAGRARFEQHVYHTGLDAWCRYQGLPAYCWAVWGDKLYFGSHQGRVIEFGVPGGDQLDESGAITPISGFAWQAWNLFGTPNTKRIAAIRPIVRSAQNVAYRFGLGYDYAPPVLNCTATHIGSPTPWNTTPWNAVPWERPVLTDAIWYIAEGDGSAVSIAFATEFATPKPLIWVRNDLRIEPGSAL